jgi:hypothetical protein
LRAVRAQFCLFKQSFPYAKTPDFRAFCSLRSQLCSFEESLRLSMGLLLFFFQKRGMRFSQNKSRLFDQAAF